MANPKYNILYGRLSQEDELKGDSNSIQNQRMLLEKYAKENGFVNVKFLYDDGVKNTPAPPSKASASSTATWV